MNWLRVRDLYTIYTLGWLTWWHLILGVYLTCHWSHLNHQDIEQLPWSHLALPPWSDYSEMLTIVLMSLNVQILILDLVSTTLDHNSATIPAKNSSKFDLGVQHKTLYNKHFIEPFLVSNRFFTAPSPSRRSIYHSETTLGLSHIWWRYSIFYFWQKCSIWCLDVIGRTRLFLGYQTTIIKLIFLLDPDHYCILLTF